MFLAVRIKEFKVFLFCFCFWTFNFGAWFKIPVCSHILPHDHFKILIFFHSKYLTSVCYNPTGSVSTASKNKGQTDNKICS